MELTVKRTLGELICCPLKAELGRGGSQLLQVTGVKLKGREGSRSQKLLSDPGSNGASLAPHPQPGGDGKLTQDPGIKMTGKGTKKRDIQPVPFITAIIYTICVLS